MSDTGIEDFSARVFSPKTIFEIMTFPEIISVVFKILCFVLYSTEPKSNIRVPEGSVTFPIIRKIMKIKVLGTLFRQDRI